MLYSTSVMVCFSLKSYVVKNNDPYFIAKLIIERHIKMSILSSLMIIAPLNEQTSECTWSLCSVYWIVVVSTVCIFLSVRLYIPVSPLSLLILYLIWIQSKKISRTFLLRWGVTRGTNGQLKSTTNVVSNSVHRLWYTFYRPGLCRW